MPDGAPRRPTLAKVDAAADFARDETVGGLLLLAATVAALVWANIGGSYTSLWETELTLGIGDASITEDLRHWVNDGLMALFFFVVAIEVKRELVVGKLADRRAAAVPVFGAMGGVALPALIFVAITALFGNDGATRGWAIPSATDIAFAVGVLALLSRWVPASLKLMLLTIAIVDDIIAIAIIALVYSSGLSFVWLLVVVGGLAGIVGLRAVGVTRIAAYVPLGLVVWVAMLESGVHATIAGVAVGLLTPARPVGGRPVLKQLEHYLHPVSAGIVVPLFALANAGLAIDGEMLADAATSAIPWGIAAGLVVGKTLGIACAVFLVVRLGVGTLPGEVRAAQIWGVAAIAGIGFTVSLFIVQLAYTDQAVIDSAKLGVFAGSLVSALAGTAILVASGRGRPPEAAPAESSG